MNLENNAMKKTALKPMLAALLLASTCAAQAAHLEVVDQLVFGGYSGSLNGAAFSADALDLSQDGDVSLFSGVSVTDTNYTHSSAADGYFFKSSQNFSMSITQAFTATAGNSFSGDTLVSMPVITLKIAADGEAAGSDVFVSFAGLASAFNSYANGAGALTMDMAVVSGSTTLGSYLWDASAVLAAAQAISFGFNAKVGAELVLSGNMLSSLSADGAQALYVSASGQLAGAFTVTAVPEPEQYAMLLAGLGLMGLSIRRRAQV